jgi:hypothetical protein
LQDSIPLPCVLSLFNKTATAINVIVSPIMAHLLGKSKNGIDHVIKIATSVQQSSDRRRAGKSVMPTSHRFATQFIH